MDYAAATPIDPAVLKVMQPYFSEQFYNPSAVYLAGSQVRKDLERARAEVAQWFGARPNEVVFTAGATEANNLAIHGVMQQFPKANMVVGVIEHDSVLAPAEVYDHKLLPVTEQGIIDTTNLNELIDDNTVLVSVQYANNEVGTIQPIKEVAALVKAVRAQRAKKGNALPLYVHTDAAQAACYLDLHASRLGADLISINGGKIYGPKQTGALFVHAGIQLTPLVYGGGQERGLRSGTENVAGCVGLATALTIAQTSRAEETKRLQSLQMQFIRLLQQKIPSVIINGSQKHRLPNNVHITIPGQDNERLLFGLDEAGVLAAAGSACSASDDTPSHVLKAMGLSDEAARASLRFTFGRQTTSQDIATAVDVLAKLLA